MTKRIFDVSLAALGLIILSPLFPLIAALVKLEDGGPVFYRQKRVGKNERIFEIWKFRSMKPDAETLGLSVTASDDARITRTGRYLRRWKLDELPQLLNVLGGDMSFVGPRPEVPRYVSLYTDQQRRVLRLLPGITDLATLKFRNEEQLLAQASDRELFYTQYCIPKKIELNLEYAATASLWKDIVLLCDTLVAIVRG